MAKKATISDFNALKGLVTFSERKLENQPTSNNTSDSKTNKPQPKEEGLKIGQCVVLMDSDLRGKIISLGRNAVIEFEDGLTIEASYGEFAVTNAAEIRSLKESKVRKKSEVNKRRKDMASSGAAHLTVDLHIEAMQGGRTIPKGQQLQFQLEVFKRVIQENLNHKGTSITFIHGVGDGILKAAIRKELDEVLALRCTYTIGDPAITTVTIR